MPDDNNKLVFQTLDWDFFHDEDITGTKKFYMRMFGMTKEQETVYLQVEDFKPYFYFEMPSKWRRNHVSSLLEEVKKKVQWQVTEKNAKGTVDGMVDWRIEEKHKLYGFTNYKKFNFVKLVFNDYDSMRLYAKVLGFTYRMPTIDRYPIKVKLYESNILPLLRFMHTRELEATGWMSVLSDKLQKFDENDVQPTCCKLNYKTRWQNVEKVDDRLIEKFVICSFDIECKSIDGSFPQFSRDGDKIIQIGLTLSRFGEDECYYKHLLSLKKTADIPGATVESFETEEELLLAFTKIIRKLNPDIITGYNIFGFDFNYMMERAKKLKILSKFCRLSRVTNEPSDWVRKDLSSAALGKNILTYYKMTGRVIIDLMKVVQRDHKLSSYKLDYVASYFIREKILKIEHLDNNRFKIYTKKVDGLYLGQYLVVAYEEGAVENKYNEGEKFQVVDLGKDYIIVNGKIDTSEFMDKGFKVFWCQAKDDLPPSKIFELCDGTPEDRAIVGKYCLMDCALCNKLVAKLQIVANNASMAIVCNVPLSYLFLRGQGVKIFSLVSKQCREENHLLPFLEKKQKKKDEDPAKQKFKDKKELEKEKEENEKEKKWENHINKLNYKDHANHADGHDEEDEEDDGYEGAIVFIPDAKVHYEPIPVLDYASLYPNSMILRNLSHEMFVNDPQYDNLPGYRYHQIRYKNNDGSITTCRFAEKLDGTKGIIPRILMALLAARKKYKKMMEEETDPFKKEILNCLQNAYKVTANSLYGQTGASTSDICMKEIAASTTATGREALLFSKYFVENYYSELINLALEGDKEKYMARAFELYKYFPTSFTVPDRAYDEKEKKLFDIVHDIHINTDENMVIPESKFCAGEIEYDVEVPFYDGKKKISKFYDRFNEMFKVWKYDTVDQYVEKFVKVLKGLKVQERRSFCDDIHKLVANPKYGFYEKQKRVLELMGFDKTSYMNGFKKTILGLTQEKRDEFVGIVDENINNMGYVGRSELFEKFYETVRNVLEGHTCTPQIIYGDSVTGDTPLMLRYINLDGKPEICIKTIQELGINWKKNIINDTKLEDTNIDYEVWSDLGWTKIKKVIAHQTTKKIYRVLTHTGYVNVTEDHSLLDEDGESITPGECNTSTKLLHSFPKFDKKTDEFLIGTDLAYIYGFFMGDGSCGKYGEKEKVKYSWALNNSDMKLCKQLKEKLETIYKKPFKILDTLKSSGVYKVVPSHGDIKSYVNEYRQKFYNVDKHKLVPQEIFNASLLEKESFLQGFYDADGCRSDTTAVNCHRFDQKSQITSMCMFYLLKSMGYNVSINTREDKQNIFRLTYSKNTPRKNTKQIKKITELEKTEDEIWVYDLETENHHFSAGVGELVVHNTDSVFFKMGITNIETGELLKNKVAMKMCIDLGIWASIMISTMLPSPMAQAYEKVLWPFVIQGKKRYVGNLYEKNIHEFKQKSMGIELKRRDNAPIVKTCCSGIIDQILNYQSSEGACDFIRKTLHKIITGKYKMDKFIITKTLKGNALTSIVPIDEKGKKGKSERQLEDEKDPEDRSYKNRNTLVHVVLADRMADRDPGNKPMSNDRIPYMYIEVEGDPELQGERVEAPDYIIANKLKVDYLFYITNQIMKPCLKFLELIANNPEDIFKEFIIKEQNRKAQTMPICYYIKPVERDKTIDPDIDFGFVDFGDSEDSEQKKPKLKSKKIKEERVTAFNDSCMFGNLRDLMDNGQISAKEKKPTKKGSKKSSKKFENETSLADLLSEF